MPSTMTRTASSVERSRSVSSTRRMNLPPVRRAYSQLKSAVRTPPRCSIPVGLGAKRVTTVMQAVPRAWGRACYQARPRCAAGGAVLSPGIRRPALRPESLLPWHGAAYRLPLPSKRAVSSAVEHCFHTAGATGSIPVPPTIQKCRRNKDLGSCLDSSYALTFSPANSESRLATEPIGALAVHAPAFPPQQHVDPPIAVAALLAGELTDALT